MSAGFAIRENTLLSESLRIPLQEHLRRVKANHERDVAEGWGRAQMPMALARKYPNAPTDRRWPGSFPKTTGGSIPRPRSKAGIASTPPWSRKPFEMRLRKRA